MQTRLGGIADALHCQGYIPGVKPVHDQQGVVCRALLSFFKSYMQRNGMFGAALLGRIQ